MKPLLIILTILLQTSLAATVDLTIEGLYINGEVIEPTEITVNDDEGQSVAVCTTDNEGRCTVTLPANRLYVFSIPDTIHKENVEGAMGHSGLSGLAVMMGTTDYTQRLIFQGTTYGFNFVTFADPQSPDQPYEPEANEVIGFDNGVVEAVPTVAPTEPVNEAVPTVAPIPAEPTTEVETPTEPEANNPEANDDESRTGIWAGLFVVFAITMSVFYFRNKKNDKDEENELNR